MSGQQPTHATTFPQRLIDGYVAFRDERLPREQDRFRELAESGQQPAIMLVGCCDSRVSPEVIFDAVPGEIFVVRNVANLVPHYEPDGQHHGTSAALEFGVVTLRVRHVVVMGHARCGGIHALATGAIDPSRPTGFIGRWMGIVAPTQARLAIECADLSPDDFAEELALASVIASIGNLRSFPFVREAEAEGRLSLHGAFFGVATGDLSILDPATGRFGQVKPGLTR